MRTAEKRFFSCMCAIICLIVVFPHFVNAAVPTPKRVVLDERRVEIYSPKAGKEVILLSDIQRPTLNGQERSIRDLVLDIVLAFHALESGVKPIEELVNKFLEKLQDQNGLSREAMQAILEEIGYDYDDARNELLRRQLVEAAIEMGVNSDPRLAISEQDIAAYYEAHPLFLPTQYVLARTVIPVDRFTSEELDELITSGKIKEAIAWGEPFTLQEQKLSKAFIDAGILNKKGGEVVDREVTSEGIELYLLVDRQEGRKMSLEERRNDIYRTIYTERYTKLFDEFCSELLKKACITFFHPEDAVAVLGDKKDSR